MPQLSSGRVLTDAVRTAWWMAGISAVTQASAWSPSANAGSGAPGSGAASTCCLVRVAQSACRVAALYHVTIRRRAACRSWGGFLLLGALGGELTEQVVKPVGTRYRVLQEVGADQDVEQVEALFHRVVEEGGGRLGGEGVGGPQAQAAEGRGRVALRLPGARAQSLVTHQEDLPDVQVIEAECGEPVSRPVEAVGSAGDRSRAVGQTCSDDPQGERQSGAGREDPLDDVAGVVQDDENAALGEGGPVEGGPVVRVLGQRTRGDAEVGEETGEQVVGRAGGSGSEAPQIGVELAVGERGAGAVRCVESEGGLADASHARDDDDRGQTIGSGRQQALAQRRKLRRPPGEVRDVTGHLKRRALRRLGLRRTCPAVRCGARRL